MTNDTQPTFTISRWDTTKDNAVKLQGHGSWEFILNFISTHIETDDKSSVGYWNLNHFDAQHSGDYVTDPLTCAMYPRRTNINVQWLTGLIIDVDNDSLLQPVLTIEEAGERFKQFTFAIIPSYSHLLKNNKPKFRIILPFKEKLPYADFEKRKNSLKNRIGYVKPELLPEDKQYQKPDGTWVKHDKSSIDNVSFTPAQGFFRPSRPVGAEYFAYVNDGDFFDWKIETVEAEIPIIPANIMVTPIHTVSGSTTSVGKILYKTFDIVQWSKDNGLYIKHEAKNKHIIRCPLCHEHTGGNIEGTAIYEGDVNNPDPSKGYPTISCLHNHGSIISGFKWLAEYIGNDVLRKYSLVDTTEVEEARALIKRYKSGDFSDGSNQPAGHTDLQPETDHNYSETVEINERYVPKKSIWFEEDKIIFLRSPKGTGKTSTMEELVKQCKKYKKSVCLIGHRVKLLEQMADRLHLKFYKDVQSTATYRHIAVCVNSLLQLEDFTFLKPYDVVIIDESEQMFSHFVGDTIDPTARKTISKFLYKLLKNSKMVVCADADMTYLSAKCVVDVCKNKSTKFIDNTFKVGQLFNPIVIYDKRDTLIEDLLTSAKNGDRIYYASNSKRKVDEVYEQLLLCNIKSYRITSDNSQVDTTRSVLVSLSKQNQQEKVIDNLLSINNLDKPFNPDEMPYQVILASPSVSTGVDIQLHFDKVFGDFNAMYTTHYDMDQQIHRVRHTDQINVFVDKKCFYELEVDYYKIKSSYLSNHKKTKELIKWGGDKEVDQDWWNWLLDIKCLVETHANQSGQQSNKNFRLLKLDQGFTLIDNTSAAKDEVDLIIGEDFEVYKSNIKSAKVIDSDDVEYLKKHIQQDDHKYQLERFWMQSFFRTSVDDDDSIIDLYKSDFRECQRRYEVFTQLPGYAQTLDRVEQDYKHIIDHTHHTQAAKLYIKGTLAFGLIDIVNDEIHVKQHIQYSKFSPNVENFKQWCKSLTTAEMKIIDLVLDGKMLDHKPTDIVRNFLKRIGIKVIKDGHTWSEQKSKITLYGIDIHHLELLQKYKKLRTPSKRVIEFIQADIKSVS